MQNRMVKIQDLIDKRQHIRNVENYIFNDDKSLVKKCIILKLLYKHSKINFFFNFHFRLNHIFSEDFFVFDE